MSVQPDSGISAFVAHDLVHLTSEQGTVAMPPWMADDLADILDRPGLDSAYVAAQLHEAATRVRSDRVDGYGRDPARVEVPPLGELPSARRIAPFTYAEPPAELPGAWRQRVAFGVFLAGLVVIGLVAVSLIGGAQ